MQYQLKTPVTREDLAPLKAGDTVLLSGTVYTARDAAHKRMMERLDAGEPLPFPVEGSAVYYVGPTPERPGEVALGGAGALMAASVKELEVICWEDLGCEAVRKLEVEDFPLTVILDAHGGDLYESGPAAYLASRDGQ